MAKKRRRIVLHKKRRLSFKAKLFSILLILIIIAVAAIYLYPKEPVIAKVNGEKITLKRIDSLYDSLPSGSKMEKNIIMWRLIDSKIFVDYIEKQGYGLAKEEFNALLNEELGAQGITMAELKANLDARGSSMVEIKDNFIIERYVNEMIIPNIEVNEGHIQTYKKMIGAGGLTDEQIRNKLANQFRTDIIKELTSNHTENVDIWINDEYRELYRRQ